MKKFIKSISDAFIRKHHHNHSDKIYLYDLANPAWSGKGYGQFSEEAYKRNVVANRCINLIASSAANVDWLLYDKDSNVMHQHPLLKLLHHPNPLHGGAEFFEVLYSHKIISGNAYIAANKNQANEIKELYILRPDRVEIIPGTGSIPDGYIYKTENCQKNYKVDKITGKSDILHLRNFNPLDDWYGLSQMESALYSIDLHNQSAIWNQSLLQNGARPSGALVIKSGDGRANYLTEEQFTRIQEQLNDKFMGGSNAGRPLLLEGGLEWQEMSYSPKDMDFIEAKNSTARDIALAFGVPPQLLGIKGDNTYSNMQEARFAFWEETIIPLVDKTVDALNNWLTQYFDHQIKLAYDTSNISALSSKQEKLWQRIQNTDFMTVNEKRAAVGLAPIKDGNDCLSLMPIKK